MGKLSGMDVAMFESCEAYGLYDFFALMKSTGLPNAENLCEEVFCERSKNREKEILRTRNQLKTKCDCDGQSPQPNSASWAVDGCSKETENGNALYAKMIDLYKKQDIEALTKMISEQMVGMKGMEEEMLDKRNQNWIPVIEQNIKQKINIFCSRSGAFGGEKAYEIL
ncbi:MAG: TraB/GumN family protein [Emticicia sp.]|nr:TraB/GumN family protein [Emticicia sp.]